MQDHRNRAEQADIKQDLIYSFVVVLEYKFEEAKYGVHPYKHKD